MNPPNGGLALVAGWYHNATMEYRAKSTYRLPPAFYFDHVYRDLPAGELEHETRRNVFVSLDANEYAELLSDARHYAYSMGTAGFDGVGLIASARATVKALETQGPPTPREVGSCHERTGAA